MGGDLEGWDSLSEVLDITWRSWCAGRVFTGDTTGDGGTGNGVWESGLLGDFWGERPPIPRLLFLGKVRGDEARSGGSLGGDDNDNLTSLRDGTFEGWVPSSRLELKGLYNLPNLRKLKKIHTSVE